MTLCLMMDLRSQMAEEAPSAKDLHEASPAASRLAQLATGLVHAAEQKDADATDNAAGNESPTKLEITSVERTAVHVSLYR